MNNKKIMDYIEEQRRKHFFEHIKECSKIVDTWPEWKKRL